MSKNSNIDAVMQSLWGDVIRILEQLNFEREDILKYTTLGTLANLHRYSQEEIVEIVKREIYDRRRIKKSQ